MKVKCPNCDATFEAEELIIGEILDCPDCGISLKVRGLERGVEVEIAAEEEEDWGE